MYKLTLAFLLLFTFGCAQTQTRQDQFMKNTPEQLKIGKLPYTNEIGALYET
ncbi:MAG: hypothetical protein JSS07_09145 [Proteobacteria bacterium]|nr:hypothetical protein [Pseudomonadota bacterium]